MTDYVVAATWPFGQTAVQAAAPLLQAGRPALDAALAGAQAVEDDPKVHSVGYGGRGDAAGNVTPDACAMDGRTLAGGGGAGRAKRRPAARAHKLPGRVGDSPLIGAGLYVDNTAGAAGGTGAGEEIIRAGGSLLIVEALRAGKGPQEACEAAVHRVNAQAVRRGVHPAK